MPKVNQAYEVNLQGQIAFPKVQLLSQIDEKHHLSKKRNLPSFFQNELNDHYQSSPKRVKPQLWLNTATNQVAYMDSSSTLTVTKRNSLVIKPKFFYTDGRPAKVDTDDQTIIDIFDIERCIMERKEIDMFASTKLTPAAATKKVCGQIGRAHV